MLDYEATDDQRLMKIKRSWNGFAFRWGNFQIKCGILILVGVFFGFTQSSNVIADTLAVYERDGHIVITNYDIPPNKVMLRISEYSLEPYSPSSSKGTVYTPSITPVSNDIRQSLPTSVQNSPRVSDKPSEPMKKSESKPAAPSAKQPDEPTQEKPKPIVQSTTTKTAITKELHYYTMKSGKRYHTNPNCGGGSGKLTSLAEISSRGLTACGKCM